MSRSCSRDIVPTMSGCLSRMCSSALARSSSSVSPRMVSPHWQSIFFATPASSDARRFRILANDDRIGDLDDLVCRQVRPAGVLADLLRARGLVDADRPDLAALLCEHVASDPPDVVGHLLVSDATRPSRSLLEIFR